MLPYDFESEEAFPGTELVRLVIHMDEYPWEIGLEIFDSNDRLVWYRPPRYYAREVNEQVVEIVSLPERSDNYTVMVGDTFGDGLGGDHMKIISVTRLWGQVIGSTSFQTGSLETFSFVYDLNAQAPPTMSPSVETPSPPTSLATCFFPSCIILLGACSMVLTVVIWM